MYFKLNLDGDVIFTNHTHKNACKELKARENSALVWFVFLFIDLICALGHYIIGGGGEGAFCQFLGYLAPVSALKKEIGFLLLTQMRIW